MPTPSVPQATSPATDATGNPTPDPTKNVDALVETAVQRLDDLRRADSDKLEAESRHLRELMDVRERYEDKLRDKEAARIDAIRAVDQGAAVRQLEVSAAQASTLAAQLAATAEASRVQMAAAATASVTSLDAALEPMRQDIRALRDAQASYQGGKEHTSESRLNVGAVLGGVSVLLVFLFGMASVAIALTR